MRYLVAIVVAVVFALTALTTVAGPLASLLTGRFSFESPDGVAELHAAFYLGTGFVALISGWLIGLLVGSRLERSDPAH